MSRFLTPFAATLPSTVPFTGPETLERQRGAPFRARLGANESGFGPSPRVLAAMREAAAEVWMYGDPENHDLKLALAERHGCTPAHVVVGPGIDNLLGLLCRLVLDGSRKVVSSLGAYPTFNFHVTNAGAELIRVPYRGWHEDPDALLAAARAQGATLIYLANPDNPMGSMHPPEVIEAMIADLPPDALLILDEAYGDLAPEGSLPRIAPDHPQVIRMRTFSKAHGMAGARVGHAIAAPELAQAFDRVRDHFGMCRISQAGALAALRDDAWLDQLREGLAGARARMDGIARACDIAALPSATNFVTLDLGRDGDFARAVMAECIARGLFIRMPGVAPLDRCIRISLGPEAAMDVVAEVLPQVLRDLRG